MNVLLDRLGDMGVENSLIIMDNAEYHKRKPDGTPVANWKKHEMLSACERYGMSIEPNQLKSELWDKLSTYIQLR